MNMSNIAINTQHIMVLAFAAFAVLAVLVAVTKRFYTRVKSTQHQIKSKLKPYKSFHNFTFSEEEDRYLQVDYLVLTESGIVLLSIFDAVGQVFAGNKMTEWTVIGKNGRYRLHNPQDSLFDQLATLRSMNLDTPILAYIVHSDSSVFSKGTPDHVINIDAFVQKHKPISAPKMLVDWEKLDAKRQQTVE